MKFILFFSTLLFVACAAQPKKPKVDTNEPLLTIQIEKISHSFTRSQLLGSPNLVEVTVEKDPAYGGKKMVYKAVPAADLFTGLKITDSSTLLFSCLDGFSAPISAKKILNTDFRQSKAYIAVESPVHKWPAIKPSDPTKTAGPFYLIWYQPEKSNIVTEEWPYQLSGFALKAAFAEQFPLTVPKSKSAAVLDGYQQFQKNCFACHTLNNQGTSQLGPDLNLPFNPTEYLKPNFLKKLIRNPQDLRHWPQSKMAAITLDSLSDSQLQNLVAYLQHMAGQKPKN